MAVQFNPEIGKWVDTDTHLAVSTEASRDAVWSATTAERSLSPAALAKATKTTVKAETFNVVALAKARLKFLAGEIKRLRVLEAEQKELQRLVKAAKEEPKAPFAAVRDIKRSAK